MPCLRLALPRHAPPSRGIPRLAKPREGEPCLAAPSPALPRLARARQASPGLAMARLAPRIQGSPAKPRDGWSLEGGLQLVGDRLELLDEFVQ